MKDLWKILTTDEDGVKYTTRDYVIGSLLALFIIAVGIIGSIIE
jgi:hypothetical protein